MPNLSTTAPVMVLWDCKTNNVNIVNTTDIANYIGFEAKPLVALQMEQIGDITFAMMGQEGQERTKGGPVVCLSRPGWYDSIKHTMGGRAPKDETKIDELEESSKDIVWIDELEDSFWDIVSISSHSNDDSGILATLSKRGFVNIYLVSQHQNKVELRATLDKHFWFPDTKADAGKDADAGNDDSGMTLTAVSTGSDFVAVMDGNCGLHVFDVSSSFSGGIIHISHGDIRYHEWSGLVGGGDSLLLAWAGKQSRGRNPCMYHFSKWKENPWQVSIVLSQFSLKTLL